MGLLILSDLTQAILMGVLLGGLYSAVGIGLSLVFGVMRLINLAHGALVLLGAYLAYSLFSLYGIDPILSLFLIVPVLFSLGLAIQRGLLNQVILEREEIPLLVVFGISIILISLYEFLYSSLSRGITTSYALTSFNLGGIRLPLIYVLDFIVGLGMMFLLYYILNKTYIGLAIQAAAQDWKTAQLMGVDTNRIYSYSFGLASALAGVAGVFLGLTFPFTPTSGIQFLIIAFGLVVLGGVGSLPGTFVGGVIFGVTQTLAGYFLTLRYQMLVAYLLIIVVLSIRPRGLFGK